jgi:hypothetical protein
MRKGKPNNPKRHAGTDDADDFSNKNSGTSIMTWGA